MKTVKIKSAIPLYLSALTWILFGLFAPIYELIYIVIAACVSLAVYMVASVFFPGRTVEVETAPDSGDEQVNRQIAEGRAALRSLRDADEDIADEAVAARAAEVRRFMNYYLPTADKLLKQYRDLLKTGSQGKNIQGAMRSIENSLELIAAAFEKQLDSLYRHEAMDIQTDIDVLETMLAADGIRVDSKQKDKEETGNV